MVKGAQWVAVILAAGAALSIFALALAAAWAESQKSLTLSTEASTLLSTSLGAAIGAVATYLGVARSSSADVGAGELERPAPASSEVGP